MRPLSFPVISSLLLWISSCGDSPSKVPPAPAASAAVESPSFPGERFTRIASASGDWRHVTSNSGEYRIPEIMCGGVAMLDFDGDDDLDVFAVQGGTWPDLPEQAALPFPGHGLFRNDGAWRFREVAAEMGIGGEEGDYCIGVVAADYDSDGDPDLYLTAFGGNRLYRNDGGQFVEIAEQIGVAGDAVFSVSACFFDADRDGHLDLYVANYLDYTHEKNRRQRCGLDTSTMRDYCSPRMFDGVQDYFFHNQGDGSFVEQAQEVGLSSPRPIRNHSKGLGVIATDIELDGDLDLYVANDATANLLFVNDGSGHFEECALLRNCAFSNSGNPQAGMGLDAGDYDRDGLLDLWVVHLDAEENAMYRNLGGGQFADTNRIAKLSRPASGQVGFGTDLFDLDHDGDLDIAIAHGHVIMHVQETRGNLRYAQRDHLLVNQGDGQYLLLEPEQAGHYFGTHTVGRGLASGDLDGDGDLDLVICARDASPAFLRNNHEVLGGHPRDALLLELYWGARPAIGARAEVHTDDRIQVEELRAGGSYGSSLAPSLHFGLGTAEFATKVVIHWPDGSRQELSNLAGGHRHRIRHGQSEAESRSLEVSRK